MSSTRTVLQRFSAVVQDVVAWAWTAALVVFVLALLAWAGAAVVGAAPADGLETFLSVLVPTVLSLVLAQVVVVVLRRLVPARAD